MKAIQTMEHISVKAITFFACSIIFLQVSAQELVVVKSEHARSNILLDDGWKFYHGNFQMAANTDFNDLDWRSVDLPHDWSIEDIAGTSSPFDPRAVGQTSSAFTMGGTGWYRKSFMIDRSATGKKIHIQFDGVYMNAEVWLNGKKLGENPYGYTSFWFDISNAAKIGEKNVVAVKVKNEGENTRWYSGSGIYRHVWLTFFDSVHVAHWGAAITTPEVSQQSARVHAQYEVENETGGVAEVRLQTSILDSHGKEVSVKELVKSVAKSGSSVFDLDIAITSPVLWSLESAYLYIAKTKVFVNDQLSDQSETSFGIRSISFNSASGFQLNGKPTELKGGCVHHDNGPLGAKAFDRAEERRVELLKASGYNAIRCAHNPPSPAFLDACDRLGMLVIDEAFDMWRNGKNSFDYHLYFDSWWKKDIESMIKRDRNHPSIIMWSIGNEIPAMDDPATVDVSKMLADQVRKLDSSRPVTAAVNDISRQKDALFATLDVGGYNYGVNWAWNEGTNDNKYETDHARVPERIMFGSESFPLEAFDYWMAAKDRPWVIGDFVWTAFDYLGEAGIGYIGFWQDKRFYPWTLAYCGDIDICGWKRPQSYYRDAFWNDKPTVSVFVKSPKPTFEENPNRASWSKWHFQDVWPSWNWAGYEGQPLEVQVYSNYDRVELFLNGKSLGFKPTNKDTKFIAVWSVPYQSGTLKAVAYKGKRKLSETSLTTAKSANTIRLLPDRSTLRANANDLSYITVELVDENGIVDPQSDNLINFEIEGPGKIIGVGNANPISEESYTQPQRKAWKGKCMVIVKSGKEAGKIVVKATSGQLRSTTFITAE
jgi:beta-galactosidase